MAAVLSGLLLKAMGCFLYTVLLSGLLPLLKVWVPSCTVEVASFTRLLPLHSAVLSGCFLYSKCNPPPLPSSLLLSSLELGYTKVYEP
jgi:hypothetical protein